MATDTDAHDPKISNPNTTQIGGTHYTDKAIQPWDAMQAWMSPEAFEGFLLGSAIAYLARYHTVDVSGKGGLQDVLKARHYLDKLIATIEAQGAVKAGESQVRHNDFLNRCKDELDGEVYETFVHPPEAVPPTQ